MSYPNSRSMNDELSAGMTDGKYKKVRQDQSVIVNDLTYQSRKDLDDRYFGIHEKQVKVTPDGLLHATPDFTPNPPVNILQS